MISNNTVERTLSSASPFILSDQRPAGYIFLLKKIQSTSKNEASLYLCRGEKSKKLIWNFSNKGSHQKNMWIKIHQFTSLFVQGRGQIKVVGKFLKQKSKKQIKSQKAKEKQKQKILNQSQSYNESYNESQSQSQNQKQNLKGSQDYNERENNNCLNRMVSTEQLELIRLKEVAIVSSHIIRMITDETQKSQGVLADKIKELTTKNFNVAVSNESLNAVKVLFEDGVNLPAWFRKQQRIQNGENQPSKKFIFHPLWMTTSSMFKIIDQHPTTQGQLITGTAGTGKTVSIILYCLLMENVLKYAMKISEEQRTKLDIKLFVQPKKVFYQSLKNQDEIDAKAQLIEQCIGLKEEQKQKLMKKTFQKVCLKIKSFYKTKNNIPTFVFVDQINSLASICRECNSIKDQLKEDFLKLSKRDIIKKTRLLSNLEGRFNQLQQIRFSIQTLGNYRIYNSSTNIEKKLFQKKTKDGQLVIKVDQHQPLEYQQINYQMAVMRNREKGIQQMASYILFELRKKDILLENDQNIKKKIKRMLSKGLNLTIVNPLLIRKCLKYAKDFQQFIQKFQKSYTEQIEKIQNLFCNFSTKLTKVEKQNFLIVMKQLYQKANTLSQKQKGGLIGIPKKEIKKCLQLSDLIDRNLFNYQDGKYYLKYPVDLFYSMTMDRFIETYIQYLNGALKQFNICCSRGVFGIMFQYSFTKAIKQEIEKMQLFQLSFSKKSYYIKKVVNFVEFNNYSNKKYHHSDNMNEIFERVKDQEDSFCMGLPVNRNSQEHSFTSFCVDFCLVRYRKDQDEREYYQVIFYDIKTGDQIDFKKKEEDIQNFKQRFQEAKGGRNIYEKFVIMCIPPEKSRDGSNFTVQNILKLKVQNFKNKQGGQKIKVLLSKLETLHKDQKNK